VAAPQKKYLSITVTLALTFTLIAASTFAQTKDKDAPARTPFQARVIVTPLGNGFQSASLDIPALQRFVIENVSVITRSPEGMRMEVNFFSYIDRNGDNVGDIADITFHRIVLVDQGVFDGVQLAAANHAVLVFADEQIGTNHYKVVAQARLNGTPPANAFTQAQFTFSGYLESLPTAQ
jgi:hypothetical protein